MQVLLKCDCLNVVGCFVNTTDMNKHRCAVWYYGVDQWNIRNLHSKMKIKWTTCKHPVTIEAHIAINCHRYKQTTLQMSVSGKSVLPPLWCKYLALCSSMPYVVRAMLHTPIIQIKKMLDFISLFIMNIVVVEINMVILRDEFFFLSQTGGCCVYIWECLSQK